MQYVKDHQLKTGPSLTRHQPLPSLPLLIGSLLTPQSAHPHTQRSVCGGRVVLGGGGQVWDHHWAAVTYGPDRARGGQIRNKTGTYYRALVTGRLQVSRLRRLPVTVISHCAQCWIPLPFKSKKKKKKERKKGGRMTVQWRKKKIKFALVAVAYGFRCSSVWRRRPYFWTRMSSVSRDSVDERWQRRGWRGRKGGGKGGVEGGSICRQIRRSNLQRDLTLLL